MPADARGMLRASGCGVTACLRCHAAMQQGRGVRGQHPLCAGRALADWCGVCPPSLPKPLLAPGCSQLQKRAPCAFPMRLPPASRQPGMLLRCILPCRRLPEEYFFPSLKTAAPGPECVNTAKYHLIAADTRGLYLLGNYCVADILNNSLSNVCPGYCRIHFIIRALGCTLLIILSNNLHSTVSV